MDRAALRSMGFSGFVALQSIEKGAIDVPLDPGVYAVIVPASPKGDFSDTSVGGAFKGRDPTTETARLAEKWVPDTEVVYFGKATSLRRRIDQFARFGRGEPIGHWGGRYLWQLQDCESLLVAWHSDPDPGGREAELIDTFVEQHGALPFANLNRPRGR